MEDFGNDLMRFDLPGEVSSIIKVIGVGGGGSNAVNYMYEQGIKGVDFIVCNTDAQSLEQSPVPYKIQLGATLTEGRGAGSIPEVGKNAAVESLDDLKKLLGEDTTMVFITAGMGGGTGTGAAPVIAKTAREMGILTVGIVTVPFMFEGKKRMVQADQGLKEMRDAVDTLLIIRNDKLRELYGNLTLNRAFSHADEVLCTAAKGIAEVITLTGKINVDMNDVDTVMRNSGVAIMGSGSASGEGRAMAAITEALESPLLNDNDITGANFVLLNITYGTEEVLMDEIMEMTDHLQEQAGMSAEVIWGYGPDDTLQDEICVTVIATGFKAHSVDAGIPQPQPEKSKYILGQDELTPITNKVQSPTQINPPSSPKPAIFDIDEDIEPFLKTKEDEVAPQNEVVENEEVEEETEVQNSDADLFSETSVELELEDLDFSLEEKQAQENQEESQKEIEEKKYNLLEDSLDPIKADITLHKEVEIRGSNSPEIRSERPSREELVSRNKDREVQIRELTLRLKTPSGLADLENEPAFKRKNVELDNVPLSGESSISRYTLSEETDSEGNTQVKLKDNNSFLHDNVD
jgi:cell division protein FtsZ